MLQRTRNIIIGVVTFVIFLLLVQVIFIKSIKHPDFTYAQYEKQQQSFNVCYGDGLASKQKELHQFIKQVIVAKSAQAVKENSLSLLKKTACNVSFVSQSDAQVRALAKQVYAYLKAHSDGSMKLLDTVYTSDQQFSAILQQPQSYLFFAMRKDEKCMLAFLATPQKDGHFAIKKLWNKKQGSDTIATQQMVAKLLLIYNQKIF